MPTLAAGISAGITLAGATIVPVAGSAFSAGVVIGQFLAANAASLLLGVSALAISIYQNTRPMASTTVNIRVDAGPRWHHAGRNKVGGQVVFGDFDADGRLWYVIYHSDSELVGSYSYMLDDVAVTVDGNRWVQQDEFKSETEGLLGGTLLPGEKTAFIRIWTTTHTPSNRVPPVVSEFAAKFPEWTANHKLVGTTYSVVSIEPVDKVSKPNIYKWQQGALRIGEPGLTVIGDWGRVYDPRTDTLADESTWGPTGNPALLAAWWRTHRWGFNRPMSEVNWTKIAAEADACDVTWNNKYAETLRSYECAVAFSEDKANIACELDILLACDGSVFFDENGKWYVEVGRYTAPTLTLSADRDITDIGSRDIEDGEAEMDGVVVRYIDASLGYIEQLSAPWVNTNFYVPGTTPRYREVSIPAIRHHSHAVRLAKIIGSRAQATRKVGVGVGPRALLAMDQRIVSLDYPGLSGPYQIVAPVEMAPDFRAGVLALVPAAEEMWVLSPTEEGDKPRSDVADQAAIIPAPANVLVASESVVGTGGTSVRLVASFDAYSSSAFQAEFAYSENGGGSYQPFTTDMANRIATTPILNNTGSYLVRWRTVTTGGNASIWTSPITVGALTPPSSDNTFMRADATLFTADMTS